MCIGQVFEGKNTFGSFVVTIGGRKEKEEEARMTGFKLG